MTNSEWAALISVSGFVGIIVLTSVYIFKAINDGAQNLKKALLCVGFFIISFGCFAVVNRLANKPFEFFDLQTAAMINAGLIWGIFVAACVSVIGRSHE